MRRSAFSIIELIFVIIIVGVLSATALVKLGSMSEQAYEARLNAMVGTLNRSAGAGFWLRSITEGKDGSIAFTDYSDIFTQFMDLIPDYTEGPALEECTPVGTGVILKYTYSDTYQIQCTDGDKQVSPKFRLYNETKGIYIE